MAMKFLRAIRKNTIDTRVLTKIRAKACENWSPILHVGDTEFVSPDGLHRADELKTVPSKLDYHQRPRAYATMKCKGDHLIETLPNKCRLSAERNRVPGVGRHGITKMVFARWRRVRLKKRHCT
eukprot:TRINITY_DN29458_c0_g1_i1.p1 TRINITY_DN29458_c0_g1~~TRINITY_DN29458_c0_g1_i1.p1  ORF type:complete len:137 (+),score=2.15 TRINITY_DN29458_c0_g1_i1:42-413(+)